MKQTVLALIFSVIGMQSFAANPLTQAEKEQVLKEVYKKLYTAMGLGEDRPELILDTQRARSVAYLKKKREGGMLIAVEEKAFDVCMSLGDDGRNALAFLLGHELGHFRYDHHWGADFASSYAIADIQEDIAEASQKLSELKFYETQADQMGGMYCYLAGYNITGLGEKLLPKIYEAYTLPVENKKYPTLDQRIEISKVNDQKMSQLIRVFEAGTFALITGEYEEASRCFDHCIHEGFKSREVYNNSAVAKVLDAVIQMGKENVLYAYPVELDVQARIHTANKGLPANAEELLMAAAEQFEHALRLDPEYTTGYINKACALSMLGKLEDAEYYAKKGLRLATDKGEQGSIGNALCILGITRHQQDDQKGALEQLQKGEKEFEHTLCSVNRQVIQGKKLNAAEWIVGIPEEQLKGEPEPMQEREYVEGIRDFVRDLEGKELEEIEMHKGACYYLDLAESKILNLTTPSGRELFYQLCTPEYAASSARGLKVGMEESKVLKAYGKPQATLATRNGVIYLFRRTQIAFFIEEGVVKNWMVYARY